MTAELARTDDPTNIPAPRADMTGIIAAAEAALQLLALDREDEQAHAVMIDRVRVGTGLPVMVGPTGLPVALGIQDEAHAACVLDVIDAALAEYEAGKARRDARRVYLQPPVDAALAEFDEAAEQAMDVTK